MVFSSLTFIYFFIALVVPLYFVCKNRVYRNTLLLIASLLFYSWGEPKLVFLMLAASFVAYVGGLMIHRFDILNMPKAKKLTFITTVVLLVLNLFWFKYFNFVAENICAVFRIDASLPHIILPIGISFYTFQILSYVIDLYRREVGVQKNYFYLTLYVAFFPQLIAGPIVRYQTIEDEIRNRKETLEDVTSGLRRFIIGLAKKVVIANNVARIAEIVFDGDAAIYGSLMYWIAAAAYALQIYFDFSGYSDMAIGLGRIFGFHFLENFNYPYISLSITEFWRRWHISLSSWFRDYIYIPLGGNRVKKSRFILNIMIVWSVTGLWHGAQWNFVMWGMYYGVLLLLEKLIIGKLLEKLPRIIRWMYTAFFVLIGWVMFNLTNLRHMTGAIVRLFSFTPTDFTAMFSSDTSIFYYMLYIPVALVCMFPVLPKIRSGNTIVTDAVCNVLCICLLIISLVYIFSSTYNPFIYFRF